MENNEERFKSRIRIRTSSAVQCERMYKDGQVWASHDELYPNEFFRPVISDEKLKEMRHRLKIKEYENV